MIERIGKISDDIICFQEFYNRDESQTFNTVQRLAIDRGYDYFFDVSNKNQGGGQFGMAIISKHPIINKGRLTDKSFLESSSNHVIYADIKLNGDTVRVYNAHLESMRIEEQKVINPEELQKNFKDVKKRLRRGFARRASQVDAITRHIKKSSFPVILSGDLNELPYSYAYLKMSKTVENAFEQAGKGFGFTYNGRLFFLRIDNVFYSAEHFKATNYKVLRKFGYSDHFPLWVAFKAIKD